MGKYRVLRDRLAVEIPAVQTNVAEPATDGELALVHAPLYIKAVVQGSLGDKAQREIGFPWSPEMVARSRRSTGATIMAARAALFGYEGIAANLRGEPTMPMRTRGVVFVFSTTRLSPPV